MPRVPPARTAAGEVGFGSELPYNGHAAPAMLAGSQTEAAALRPPTRPIEEKPAAMPAPTADDRPAPGRPMQMARRFGRSAAPALVLLLLALGGFALNFVLGERAARVLARDNLTLLTAQRVLSDAKDLETGERGYLLTGDESYLAPYFQGVEALSRVLAGPASDMATERAERLAELRRHVDAKKAVAARLIEARRTQGEAAALLLLQDGQDKSVMDALRAEVALIQNDWRVRIARQTARGVMRNRVMTAAAAAAALLAACWLAAVALSRRRQQRSAAELLEGVLENAPVGLGFLDQDLRFRHMNLALAAMGDRALGASIGLSIWAVLPELRERLEPRLQGVIESGLAVPSFEVEASSNERAGQTRHFQVAFFPLRAAGDVAGDGAGIVVADITTRKRAEERLILSEQRFRSLIAATTAIVWTTAASGEFVEPQAEWTAFTGQGFEQMRGWGWREAIHPDDRDSVARKWDAAREAHALCSVEHRLLRRDGEWRVMAMRAVPILEDDVIREWVGLHVDVTERRQAADDLAQAKEAAEAASRAKSQFLANMSHELRTPLSAVIGYTEMLEEEVEELEQPQLLDDLRKIEGNARHLLSLINGVLDLSKIEANRMTVFPETFEVADLVHEVASTVDALVRKKANALVVELGAELGPMRTDAVKLRQCLFNLIGNAAKFTERGRITVQASRSRHDSVDWVQFEVADTGIGMNAEQLRGLFERFSQADVSTTRRFGGTGLGLAITRAFARLLGGDITVDSDEGHGSTFRIRVPANLPEAAATDGANPAGSERPAPPESEAAVPSPADCVLVIDDDPAARDLLARFLEREGHRVCIAADGRAGLELAHSAAPRLILLDVMMPQMDGWSVLSALKADPALSAIPVVMTTFMADQNLAYSLGAADYLMKPIEWDALKRVLDRLAPGQAGSILTVDDDADTRQRLGAMLARSGWTVTEAASGQAALEAVAQGVPALVLLDLLMPGMDGFAFLRAFRDLPGCREVPVVVLTAKDLTPEDLQRLKAADQVLPKDSATMRDLGETVRHILSAAPAAQPAPELL